jgi:hypothetical protein
MYSLLSMQPAVSAIQKLLVTSTGRAAKQGNAREPHRIRVLNAIDNGRPVRVHVLVREV